MTLAGIPDSSCNARIRRIEDATPQLPTVLTNRKVSEDGNSRTRGQYKAQSSLDLERTYNRFMRRVVVASKTPEIRLVRASDWLDEIMWQPC